MTLAEIKREINLRLREVKADSVEYSDTTSYMTLLNLISKAIERVSKCTSADELESIDNLLGVIEDCYNDCLNEKDESAESVTLFDFHFELDVDESASCDAESSDTEKEDSGAPEIVEDVKELIDVSKEIAEIEESCSKLLGECDFLNKIKLKSLRKKSISSIKAASVITEVVAEMYKFRRKIKRLSLNIDKVKKYNAAKPLYDDLHAVKKLSKANFVRLIFGIITAVGGSAYGLFEARWWPWERIAYAITGIGVFYLILSLIYAVVIVKSTSKGATRHLCVMRLILAIIFAFVSLPAGIIFDDLGIGVFYLATVPFTLCGVAVYLVYRFKLINLSKKKKK